ncbi:MAG: hypothetical protein KatS3mg089_1026 [Patescibacteria group bacterium]|nr:MAG: hypothetical protein KatS3mg089_1026 [Patescibacteria group bacterium]
MKERNLGQLNQEKLTGQGSNIYANSGEKSMPDEKRVEPPETAIINTPLSETPDEGGRRVESVREPITVREGILPQTSEIIGEGENYELPPLTPKQQTLMAEYKRRHPNASEEQILEAEKLIRGGINPLSEEQERRFEGIPQNFNELIEEIMKNSDPKWSRGGEYSLVKTVKDEKTGKDKEIIDQANFLRWVRDRMLYFHNESPDEQFSLFAKVRLQREVRDISIGEMIEYEDRYFRDKDRNQYKELVDQLRKELWQFSMFRLNDLKYKAVMGSDTELPKAIQEMFYYNFATKTVWGGKSALAWVLTMPDAFTSNPITEEHRKARTTPEQPELDTATGQALNTAFLTYYYISDIDMLRVILGEDAPLLDKEEIKKIIRQRAAKKFGETDEGAKALIQDRDGLVAKLFDKTEEFNEEDLRDFINIFNSPEKHTEIIGVVNDLIALSIKKKYSKSNINIEEMNIEYARTFAGFMARMFGAGYRNDLKANANDAGAKPGNLMRYRLKQVEEGRRGGAFGTPYNVYFLKELMVDFLSGSRTESLVLSDDGTYFVDSQGKKHYYTPLEVMLEMEKMLDDPDFKSTKIHELAKRLLFPDNTMRQYAGNHVIRAFSMFTDITEATEINWSKFITYDPFGRVVFNRKEFETEVKENFFKKMRYAWSTYGQLDFSKSVRTQVEKVVNGKKVSTWEWQPLASRMFGYEILNTPEFWATDEKGRVLYDENGNHLIDYFKVNADKTKLWKRVALARIAAELYSHRNLYSTDPRYNFFFYEQVIEALRSIPSEIVGDEFDLRSVKTGGQFFSDEDLEWLRKHSSTTWWELYRGALISDVFQGSIKGYRKAISLFLRMIIEQ